MTFLVKDSQIERHEKIIGFLNDGETVIATLLAAVDFEWTVRRGVLALGHSSNVEIRSGVLANCSGLNKYKDAWSKEVKRRFGKGLPDIISDWDGFKKAFALRHQLVHGVEGTTGQRYAEKRILIMLQASKEVAGFAQLHSIDLFNRLPIRRRKSIQ